MDKTPDLGLPFFYRVVLPGTAATVMTLPFVSPVLTALGIAGRDQTPYLIGLALLLGFVLSLLDDPIYQILEGRVAWPRGLSAWRVVRWSTLVKSTMARQNELSEGDAEYRECWYLLRQFPVDGNGDPTVLQPSRIGNVIAAYEQYPEVRYGMDSVFYWPRLWLVVDKDTRDEIDNPWAAVDGILYIGSASAVIGVVYLMLAISTTIGVFFSFPGLTPSIAIACVIATAALFVVSLASIRLAVPGLVANGEKFKSLFDLYRSKLALSAASDQEKAAWTRLRNQLQYGLNGEESNS